MIDNNLYNKICVIPVCCLLLVLSIPAFAQNTVHTNPFKTAWTAKHLFEQKVFIENKGQYDPAIKYATVSGGVHIYFTQSGVIYQHDVVKQEKDLDKKEAGDPDKQQAEVKHLSTKLNWIGADQATEISTENRVSFYYTYFHNSKNIVAHAYTKLIYHNIYPHIDLIYSLPDGDKTGIKYAFILHPGANPELIRMKWKGHIKKGTNGNIIINNPIGRFVDHHPKTYDTNTGTTVSSSFVVSGNTVAFHVANYDRNNTITIDPWVSNPAFTTNKAFDVNYDNGGNVYAYGSGGPFQLAKFNSGGTLLWTFTTTSFSGGYWYYGDFAVDAVTGTSYIGEGFRSGGARVLKVNTNGSQTGEFTGYSTMREIWRMDYNYCNGSIICAGGGTSSPSQQASVLDTNMVNITPVPVVSNSPDIDAALLSNDKYSNNAYMLFAQTLGGGNAAYNNELVKVPLPGLSPVTWGTLTGHGFTEVNSVTYYTLTSNGFNGIAVSPNYVYTYDGGNIKKWNKSTGAAVSNFSISSTLYTWGGLDVDACNDLYVGYQDSIIEYDSLANRINAFGLPNTVYDLKLGGMNKLYACGNGFVAEIDVPLSSSTSLTSTPACTGCNGTATVSISSCNNIPYSYKWMPGGQTTQTITGLCAGTYTVTVSTSCEPVLVDSVTITGPGVINAQYAYNNVCHGDTTIFTDSSTISQGTISSWHWDFGDGDTSSLQSPTHVYASSGDYTVTLTPSQTCSFDSIKHVIHVYDNPVTSIATTPTCANSLEAFTNNSSIASGSIATWDWNFGDTLSSSDSSAIQNPTHNYTTAGTYTVVLNTTSDHGCRSTDTTTVTVAPLPTAAFSSDVVCLNNPTHFTDQSQGNGGTISSWHWDFGEPSSGINDTSSLQNPTHTYSTAGTFTVTLLVTTTSGCIDTISHPVYVNPLPVAAFTGTNECFGNTTTFTDQSSISGGTITNWSWNFGETTSGPNNISNQQNTSHTYAQDGIYPVILTVTSDSGCQSTVTHNVTVYPIPVASFTSTTVCYGDSTQFTDNSSVSSGTITSWDWDFGDGSTHGTQESPAHLYGSNGTYTVILTITTNGGCQDSDTNTVVVNAMPVAAFSATNVCLNVPTIFTDSSTIPSPGVISNWQWDFGDGSQSSSQNPSHTYNAPGTYTVMLTVTSAAGCDSAVSKTVTVYPLPTANFTNTNVCDGTTTIFTDSSSVSSGSIASWQWNMGDGSTSSTQSPSHLYNTPGIYSTSLLVTTDHGCKDSITKPVYIYNNPVVAFSVDSPAGCAIHCVNFTDSSYVNGGDSLVNWLWNMGDGGYATDENPAHCYPDAGTYSVGLTVTSNHGCQTSYTHPDMITVYPLPTAAYSVAPQPTTIVNAAIHFTDQSLDAVAWHWSFGDGDTLGLSTENPIHTYEDTGKYHTSLVVYNQYGCRDTANKYVYIEPEFTFYVPNAFSPNGDGLNDYFSGKGEGIVKYQMWIFDRWGNMIFYTDDINKPWDGKVQKGSTDVVVQEDVYVWMVKIQDVFGKLHSYIGHVSVIK